MLSFSPKGPVLTVIRAQIKIFVEGLFTLNNAYDRFKLNVRDFLIQLKEFSGDNAELYAEEKEQQDLAAKAAERERLSKVGGLLKPAELDEDDELWLDEELSIDCLEIRTESEPSNTQRYRPPTTKLDGWDVYGLWASKYLVSCEPGTIGLTLWIQTFLFPGFLIFLREDILWLWVEYLWGFGFLKNSNHVCPQKKTAFFPFRFICLLMRRAINNCNFFFPQERDRPLVAFIWKDMWWRRRYEGMKLWWKMRYEH